MKQLNRNSRVVQVRQPAAGNESDSAFRMSPSPAPAGPSAPDQKSASQLSEVPFATFPLTSDEPAPDLDSLLSRAHMQCELAQYDDAERTLAAILEIQPGHATAAYNRAICLEKLGRTIQAAAAFEAARVLDPQRAELSLGLALARLRLDDGEGSLEALDAYQQAGGKDDNARFCRAVALQLLWRFDEAFELYQQLLDDELNTEHVLTNLIALAMARKDAELTSMYSERLLALRPSSLAALDGLASCALSMGDYEAAYTCCQKLSTATPDHFERAFNLGVACHRTKRLQEAEEAFLNAVRIRPDARHALSSLGLVRQAAGNLKGAREAFEKALQLAPDLPELIFNVATVIEQQGSKEQAERLYLKLVTATPDHAEGWFRLGYIRLSFGEPRFAAEAFEHCVRFRPDWEDAYLNLAIAHWRAGNGDAAAVAFLRVLEGRPNCIDALRGLAAVAMEQKDYLNALEFQGRLIDLGERSPELFYNTGLLLHRSGHTTDAIRLYREALQDRPEFPEALLNLGHALKDTGDPDSAHKFWRKAIEVKPELASTYF